MNLKKIISTILLIIWMIVIFMFSSENSSNSEIRSDRVTRNAINTVSKITGKEYTEEEKDNFIIDSRFIVRKLAHFTLYFILGIIVYYTLKSYKVSNKLFIYSIFFCLIYAISDEIHQIFASGRTFKILDILIDTSGSLLSNSIIYLMNRKINKII